MKGNHPQITWIQVISEIIYFQECRLGLVSIPRCSMVLEYSPTKLGHLWGKYQQIFQHHGAYWFYSCGNQAGLNFDNHFLIAVSVFFSMFIPECRETNQVHRAQTGRHGHEAWPIQKSDIRYWVSWDFCKKSIYENR